MKSVERSRAGAGDSTRPRECYRCDRDVAPSALFRVAVEPPSVLSARYARSVRFCCPHCAAAMNLSDFADCWKAHAKRE
nr:hypothetical protein [Halovivax limisalsi]